MRVHYTGWLMEGTTRGRQFASSHDRGRPIAALLGRGAVIAGWDRGIHGMRVGGKRRLTVPSELAYGAEGTKNVPPNATLVFEVELVEVLPPKADTTPSQP